MNRRMFLYSFAAAISMLASSTIAFGKHWDDDDDLGNGHGNDHNHGHGGWGGDDNHQEDEDDDWRRHRDDDRHGWEREHGGYFQQRDYVLIGRYYRGPRDLPPGLRRKYYRTGTLPPSWAKKFEPFPPVLVQRLPPPPPGCEMGYYEGRAVVVNRTTRVILDSIDIASAFARR